MIVKGTEIGEYRPTPLGSLQVMDSHVKVYSSGKIFIQYLYDDLLGRLAEHMHSNVDDDFDNVVVIEGGEGVGKSAFTWNLAECYQPGFDFESQLTYSFDELREKLKNGNDKRSVFWLDEAYDIANKREWQSEQNRIMVKTLVKMRSRHWTLLMDVPRSSDMDFYIRDHRARYLVTVEYGMEFDNLGRRERGIFQLQVRSRETGKWVHCGYGLFPPIPREVKKIYEKYKEASQDKDLQDDGSDRSPGAKYKAKYETERRRLARTVRLLRNMGMPPNEIRQQLGLSEKQYYHLLELDESTTEFQED